MDYSKLKAELADDPAGIGYASMTDAERYAAYHARTQPVRVLVPRWKIKEAIYLAGRWPALVDLQSNENADLATLARTAVAYLSDEDFENVNLDYPIVKTMLDTLLAVGLLTQELRDVIEAFGDDLVSRGQQIGMADVEIGNFASARQMMEGAQ